MLIKCPKCNHYISDIASVCPSCGMILKGEDTLPEKENATEALDNESKEILEKAGLNFIPEYSFPDLVGTSGKELRFDFAVFDD